jgi:hypothetical protein
LIYTDACLRRCSSVATMKAGTGLVKVAAGDRNGNVRQ